MMTAERTHLFFYIIMPVARLSLSLFFFPQTKQSFEYEGQTQVEFLMTHPVYPAAVAVVIWLSQTVFPAVEATPGICTLWSSRDRLKESDGI